MLQQRQRAVAARADAAAEEQHGRLLARGAAAEGARRAGEAQRAGAEAGRKVVEEAARRKARAVAKARADADARAKTEYYRVRQNPTYPNTLSTELCVYAHASLGLFMRDVPAA